MIFLIIALCFYKVHFMLVLFFVFAKVITILIAVINHDFLFFQFVMVRVTSCPEPANTKLREVLWTINMIGEIRRPCLRAIARLYELDYNMGRALGRFCFWKLSTSMTCSVDTVKLFWVTMLRPAGAVLWVYTTTLSSR